MGNNAHEDAKLGSAYEETAEQAVVNPTVTQISYKPPPHKP